MNLVQIYAAQLFRAFKSRNSRRMRRLSDHILSDAALDPSPLNISLAVLSYILSKILSKPRFLKRRCIPCLKEIERLMQRLIKARRNSEECLEIIERIEREVSQLDRDDPRFLNDLITKGKLKTAATLYAQGLSAGISAQLVGVDKHDLLEYAGQTLMVDRLKEKKPITKRMAELRAWLGV